MKIRENANIIVFFTNRSAILTFFYWALLIEIDVVLINESKKQLSYNTNYIDKSFK